MTNREQAESIAKWAETISRPHSDTTLLKGILHAVLAMSEPYIPENDPGNFNYGDKPQGLEDIEDPEDHTWGTAPQLLQADLIAAEKRGRSQFARELSALIDTWQIREIAPSGIINRIVEKLHAKDTIR